MFCTTRTAKSFRLLASQIQQRTVKCRRYCCSYFSMVFQWLPCSCSMRSIRYFVFAFYIFTFLRLSTSKLHKKLYIFLLTVIKSLQEVSGKCENTLYFRSQLTKFFFWDFNKLLKLQLDLLDEISENGNNEWVHSIRWCQKLCYLPRMYYVELITIRWLAHRYGL